MLRVRVARFAEINGTTLGVLHMPGLEILTLELSWNNNLPNRSCIPAGKYLLQRHRSPKFGEVFEVVGVPGRDDILIHAGNTRKDTTGCIIPGLRFGRLYGLPAVLQSKIALTRLMQELDDVNEAHFEIANSF